MYTREEVNSPILLFGCQVYLSFFLFAFLSYYFLYILCARIVLSFTLFKNEYLLKSFIKIMLPEFVKYYCYIYSIHAINKGSLSLSLSLPWHLLPLIGIIMLVMIFLGCHMSHSFYCF